MSSDSDSYSEEKNCGISPRVERVSFGVRSLPDLLETRVENDKGNERDEIGVTGGTTRCSNGLCMSGVSKERDLTRQGL